ncbi:MAG: hypothetical protein L6N94_05520 [Candidatus Methylarchaceae archaeon HK01M]|nr:hypothetical protein [Candidatus Methylarchaceae archaeon HK01M]
MTGMKELSDDNVHDLVYESIELIKKVQRQLQLPISPNLRRTIKRLKNGCFKAEHIRGLRKNKYTMEYGMFIPPSTIILDKHLLKSDKPMDIPEFVDTFMVYNAVHEVLHADDNVGGDKLLLSTLEHIIKIHGDKLEKSMEIIKEEGNHDCIRNKKDLAFLWAIQYNDVVTHYRTYVVLRHMKYPKLDHIWSRLRKDYFPPHLLTNIEIVKGIKYVFSLFTEKLGEYCLIEAYKEHVDIKERDSFKLIV